MILTVHVVVIGGMLLQGCKDTSKADANKDSAVAANSTPDTSAPPAAGANSNPSPAPVADTSVPPVTSTATLSNQTMTSVSPGSVTPGVVSTVPPVSVLPPPASVGAPAATSGEYVIAQGDTMGAIAKKNSVSLRALMEANPGVNPKKLQIGHKLQIPAGGPTIAGNTTATPNSGAIAADTISDNAGSTYVVKSGDTLGRIARAHGTSFKRIMALNDLKTTAIRVGQKLKMPAPKPAGTESIPAAASIAPASTATPGPGPISSATPPTAAVAN
jgi:LysM repeat protein